MHTIFSPYEGISFIIWNSFVRNLHYILKADTHQVMMFGHVTQQFIIVVVTVHSVLQDALQLTTAVCKQTPINSCQHQW